MPVCSLLSSLLEDEGASMQKQELVLLVSTLGHTSQQSSKRTDTVLFMNSAYNAHPIATKRVLTREFAMSVEDIEVFEKATLIPGFALFATLPSSRLPSLGQYITISVILFSAVHILIRRCSLSFI